VHIDRLVSVGDTILVQDLVFNREVIEVKAHPGDMVASLSASRHQADDTAAAVPAAAPPATPA